MFARKLKVEYPSGNALGRVPLKWLDNFAMRNFTNDPLFDDTLPISDGLIEVGSRVPIDRLKAAMEDWFRRKGYIDKTAELTITDTPSRTDATR